MGEEDEVDKPAVGRRYKGSVVVNIDEERSARPNGLIRVRKSIELDSGMILLEDEYEDMRKIEGEYQELQYKEVPSPRGIKLPVDHEKRRKKKPKSPSHAEDDARREAEARAKIEAEEKAKKERAARELKEAKELAMKKEAEMRAKKEAEEQARRAEEERLRLEEEERKRLEEDARRKEEEARKEEERRRREREDEQLRASQEAARKRKEENDRRREAERKVKETQRRRQTIVDSWQPQPMWAYSPESNIKRKDGKSPNAEPQAIWMYAPGHEPDKDFDWWKPQSVIVHPPGKPLPGAQYAGPHGLWAYAPGTEPGDDDDDWNPKGGGASQPKILLFPPGVEPSVDDKNLKVQGEWSYPEGDTTSFPPLPTPKNDWEPKSVKVHPKSKAPGNGMDDNAIHGQWMVFDGDSFAPMGEDDWRVAEIQVYPEGKAPKDLSNAKVQGVWGLAPGAKPNEDGEWDAKDLWFFGPGDTPPDDEAWSPQGIWTHSPEEERDDWPPKSEPQDDWNPQAIWVYPPGHIPEDEDEEWKPTGVWKFGDRPVDEAEDWMPCQVTVHPKGQEPDNLDEFKVHGVWGLSPGAEPDDDGNWKASDIWFIGPGEAPPEDWRPQGVWTVSPETDNEDEDWPPKRSTSKTEVKGPVSACVYPASKAPTEGGPGTSQGVWTFGAGSDDDEPDWMPQNVLLYPAGTEPDDLEKHDAHGTYGYAPGAKPDADGNYKPSDMWFFMPGEEPSDDDEWNPQGTWSIPPGQLNVQFPQKPKDGKKAQNNVGKLPKSSTVKAAEKTGGPRKVWVYPKKKVPKDIENGVPKGVWSYTPGKKVMDAGKKPTQVDLYEKGQEPDDLSTRHGVWGYAPGAQPNESGEYLPEALWLFAPGETPPGDDEWQPQGVWTEPPPPPKTKETPTKAKKPEKKEPKDRKRQFEKSAWVYPSKDKAPVKGEKKNPQGCWAHFPGGSEDDEPREILYYSPGHEPRDAKNLPHGAWGYAPGSQPDADGVWSPKDMLFFPPGEDPPPDLQQQGVWTYPHGSRIEVTSGYRYDGDDIIYTKTTEIFYMDTVIRFEKEWKKP